MTREELIESLRNMDDRICRIAADLLETDNKKSTPAVKLNGRGGRRYNRYIFEASMSPEKVREARSLRVNQKKPIKELMAKYGVSRSTLRNALYGLGYYEGIV